MKDVFDFADLMREHEAELMREGQAQIAREDAAYRALPQAERDRMAAAYEAQCEARQAAIDAAPNHGECTECGAELDASEAADRICDDCQNGGEG